MNARDAGDESFHEAIRSAKRGFWAQKGAAQEYQFEAFKTDPLRRLKNVLEIGFVLRHVQGQTVLDAGAGTGRFTLALEARGFHTIAVDLSQEMLIEARRLSLLQNRPFRAAQGDVERLPFPDNTFDSVVSIAVLRHFHHWRELLAELARITRPGGRIIFDMASGEHRRLLNTLDPKAVPEIPSPQTYDACATFHELQDTAKSLSLRVIECAPNDFFENNALFDAVLGARGDAMRAELRELLSSPAAVALCETIARRFLPAAPLALGDSWLAVVDKPSELGACSSQSPSVRSVTSQDGLQPQALFQARLGLRYASYLREVARCLEAPEADRLWNFLKEELLPHVPREVWSELSND